MQSKYTTGPVTFNAGEDLAQYRRVKLESGSTMTPLEVVYADAGEDFIGITMDNAKDGDLIAVAPLCREGTFLVTAADTFAAMADIYGAADGKVSDTSNGSAFFKALEAATAAGDIVEVILHPGASTISSSILIADPGDGEAIPVTQSGVCAITTEGAETRTLADPNSLGIRLTITLDVDGGNCVVTAASAINVTGNNTITLADAGDTLDLVATQVGGAKVWRVSGNDGAPLTTV